ncbi:hypothetical protein [Halosimplex pelagicum]|uniref:Uncharacterized protein n=1 Tax=Halosimplex pelagicum TaxID=869886 RepID=A0A7D5TBT0_9EURY|nr:hypothetical protein [Halosimplex pelagicum]QLH82329.1 hypothetical protein HZS54_12205 [Halosimplex pelagicum]
MGEATDIGTGEEPYVRACQCTACNTDFERKSYDVTETAQAVVEHWNKHHPDILKQSYTAYQTVEQERREPEEGVVEVQREARYLTVYDVLAISDQDALFNPAFAEKVLLNEVCEDCGTRIEELEDYEELGQEGPITKYLCRQCRKDRKIRRRKANNVQLTAFERA